MSTSKFESRRAKIKLRRLLKETESGLRPAMQDSMNKLQKEMQRRAPNDTGNLKETITAYVSKDGTKGEVGFRGKKGKRQAFYARFIEFGTKGHQVSTYKKQVLSDGSNTFGTKAYIPPLPARPFIDPSWQAMKPEIVNRITKAINEAIKTAQEL